eukprot:TRINITY_DN5977_c0_g1_i1.p1 TRINITY_DN5977_c0_g1~~TRINITY_DN5977_c0_g1_i1.p1  ORF type:complete len:214 (-),score=30.59 TRINITY_DN5977_c0_g1_i1:102-743(-)
MDDKKIIDFEKGMENFGSEETLREMISDFEETTANENLRNVYEAMQEKDWRKLRNAAYVLHHCAGYIGATRFMDIARNLMSDVELMRAQGGPANGDISQEWIQRLSYTYMDLMVEAKVLKVVIAKYLRREANIEMMGAYLQYTPGETGTISNDAVIGRPLEKNEELAKQNDDDTQNKKNCEIFQRSIVVISSLFFASSLKESFYHIGLHMHSF